MWHDKINRRKQTCTTHVSQAKLDLRVNILKLKTVAGLTLWAFNSQQGIVAVSSENAQNFPRKKKIVRLCWAVCVAKLLAL